MISFKKFLLLIQQRNDVLLASIMVAIVFMIVLPLPTWLIDILIAINLSISAILLMLAIYLQQPLDFSTFPSVLLVTTLFRLALAISTTRLILLQADAGEIVQTFGDYVVAGNIVVGIVIFLIITVVQFVVITKGSERVAEVSARFSLDAMPGKQMSIDGDLRAGVIDVQEAKRRRQVVEKESQLYGAMDGAMKFVKGDAIAGIIIIAVNIVGGIAIGTLQIGLPIGEAMSIYTTLTVGDGLVQQIPALFISITSGMIVTRVSNEDGINLGDDIGNQVISQPRAILIAGLISVGFSLVPGMPTSVFLGMAVLLAISGITLIRRRRLTVTSTDNDESFNPEIKISSKEGGVSSATSADAKFSTTIPLLMDAANNISKLTSPKELSQELVKVRDALYHDYGVPFPGIHLQFNDSMKDNHYEILIQEVPVAQGNLKNNFVFVTETAEALSAFGVQAEVDDSALPGAQGVWVASSAVGLLKKAGINYMEATQVIAYHLSTLLKRYAHEFIGLQEVRFFLDNMETSSPEIARELQRVLSTQKITEVLSRLVSENISIRNLKLIFTVLIDWGQREKDTVLLTEYIRGALKRQISFQYTGDHNILPVYLLSTEVEDAFRSSVRHTSSGSYLALEAATSRRIFENIKQAVGDISTQIRKPVLLTSMDIRRYVRKMLERDFYDLAVLSYQELTPEVTIQPLAKIDL